MLVGGHVSAAGGISKSLLREQEIGGNCVQLFSASPRSWARSPLPQKEIETFLELQKQLGIKKAVIHAMYLINLASPNAEAVKKSRSVIEYDLQIDSKIGSCGVVVHLGSHLGIGFEKVRQKLAEEIKICLHNTPDNSTFLIENSAGQKGKIASDFSEIRWLLDAVGSKRVGWCLDSCHAWAAGYDLSQNTSSPKNIFQELNSLNLWDSLKVIHLNDSRDPFGSGRDRHANIGDGTIGNEVLESFVTHPKISLLPFITEVPGIDGKSGPDKENIARIKKFLA